MIDEDLNIRIAKLRGYTVERLGETSFFELKLNGNDVFRAHSEDQAWIKVPDFIMELKNAYCLFLDLLAAHCDPALVAGWEPGTVECNTVEPNLSNAAPKDQPALAIALTWVEWKESLNG